MVPKRRKPPVLGYSLNIVSMAKVATTKVKAPAKAAKPKTYAKQTSPQYRKLLKTYRESIGNRLQKVLEFRELSQVQFAKLSGLKVAYINRVARGEANLTLGSLAQIEVALKYPLIVVPSEPLTREPVEFNLEIASKQK